MTRGGGEDAAAQAAAWYARLNAGDATAQDRAAHERWRQADAAHGTAVARIEALDAALGQVKDDPALAALRADARAPAARPHAQYWPITAIAAALVAVIATGTLLPVPHDDGTSAPTVQTQAATGAVRYATAVGEQRRVRLPDGSIMMLDAASSVIVPPQHGERRVELHAGRAAFAVAKDRAHPFVVATSDSTVTALGTHFTVERGGTAAMTVALTEGAVRVATPLGARVLAPGQVLTMTTRAVAVARDGAQEAAGWQEGRLTFAATPLAQVAAALQRYDARHIVIRDAALAAHPFSGSLRTRGGTDALVAALEAYGTARVTRRDATTIVLTPR